MKKVILFLVMFLFVGNVYAKDITLDDMVNVINNYHNRLKKNKELTGKYEALCADINERVAEVANAEDANNFIDWVGSIEHIYNSKVVASKALANQAKELNLTFNKATKKYA